jgi:formate dehydrogenase
VFGVRAACGLIAAVKDGRRESLSPDPEHPASQGFACAKGLGFGAVLSDPDRVTTTRHVSPKLA